MFEIVFGFVCVLVFFPSKLRVKISTHFWSVFGSCFRIVTFKMNRTKKKKFKSSKESTISGQMPTFCGY